jgi:hypothetical protein
LSKSGYFFKYDCQDGSKNFMQHKRPILLTSTHADLQVMAAGTSLPIIQNKQWKIKI